MQHEYTNEEINEALTRSYNLTGDHQILDVSNNGFRKFLEALPKQPPGQAISADDVQVGDRISLTDTAGDTHEATVTYLHDNRIMTQHNGWLIFNVEHIHLIDRPIVYPDPHKDLLIRDDISGKEYVSVGDEYRLIGHNAVHWRDSGFFKEWTLLTTTPAVPTDSVGDSDA